MSEHFCAETAPLADSAVSDAEFLDHHNYASRFATASLWLRRLILHRINDSKAVAHCYQTHDYAFPKGKRTISDLLSKRDNRFCERFECYCRKIAEYGQGSLPRKDLDIDYRLANILLNLFASLIDDKILVRRAVRSVDAFYRLVAGIDPKCKTKEEYRTAIETHKVEVRKTFARIGDGFARMEQAPRETATGAPATKEDVEKITTAVHNEATAVHAAVSDVKTKQDVTLAAVTDVKDVVKRIDNRDKQNQHKRKSLYSLEQLNAIHTLWLTAQQNFDVKSLSKRRSSYEAAIIYYKNEFRALGIFDAVELKKALKAWSQRVARTTSRGK